MPSIDDQVDALLRNESFKFASITLGVETMHGHGYREVFTVRRRDIEKSIRDRDLRLEDYAEGHWLNLFQRDGKWIVSEFHPGEHCADFTDEVGFENEEKAKEYLLTRILNNSQTGIQFR